MAEILLNSEFGNEIYNVIKNNNYCINLEIGSQDGGGSTQSFLKAMDELSCPNKVLYCIEIRADYQEKIKQNVGDRDYVRCAGSILTYETFLPKNFDTDVWHSPHNKITKHGYEEVKGWYDRDVVWLKNIKNTLFTKYPDATEFDAVFIDGGEFNGYSEFVLFKDKAKCFILDDCFNAFKCTEVYHSLKNNSKWKLVKENPHFNNGYAIFQLAN